MTEPEPRKSAFQKRIDAGLADPISDEERELVKRMRQAFFDRYGETVEEASQRRKEEGIARRKKEAEEEQRKELPWWKRMWS